MPTAVSLYKRGYVASWSASTAIQNSYSKIMTCPYKPEKTAYSKYILFQNTCEVFDWTAFTCTTHLKRNFEFYGILVETWDSAALVKKAFTVTVALPDSRDQASGVTYGNIDDIYDSVVGELSIEVKRGEDTPVIWLPKVRF